MRFKKSAQIENVIQNSVKEDKLKWLEYGNGSFNLQKTLMLIHRFSLEYPNTGTISTQLDRVDKKISNVEEFKSENIEVLISILSDIALRNTRTYPQIISILSKLFPEIKEEKRKSVIEKVLSKLKRIPNTGHFEIWIQRATHKYNIDIKFEEKICDIVNGNTINLWESSWIEDEAILEILNDMDIIDRDSLEEIEPIIDNDEVALFKNY